MAQENNIIEIVFECFIHIYKYPGQLEDLDIQHVFINGGMLRGIPSKNLAENILIAGYQIKAYTSLDAIQMIIMELKRLLHTIEIVSIFINEISEPPEK